MTFVCTDINSFELLVEEVTVVCVQFLSDSIPFHGVGFHLFGIKVY